jgi:4-aminobutyrate aminotransferase-like enzyme/Ser/Thr protein kinase RdoA (MazF antagonist)/sugar phosphate permease
MVDPNPTRPRFSSEAAIQIARDHFALAVSGAESLPSDRDQNFLLTEAGPGRCFVLKIAHSGEDHGALDFQNRILEHLTRAAFPLSNVLRSVDGDEIIEVDDPKRKGDTFLTRLLTWIPGTLLSQVNPQSPRLFDSLGAFLGAMDRTLEDFSHPAQDRELKWDLKRSEGVIRDHLQFVEDPKKRTLLERLAEDFQARLRPLIPHLRNSVIHADANDYNVLVSDLEPEMDPDERRVVGLVDFGDAVWSYTAGEAAIAGAYAMLGKKDPFTAASRVVAGYHRAFPLMEEEVAALLPLMGLRLCTSVAIAAFQKWREPGNTYLTVSESQAWDLLGRLETESLDFPHFLFRQACGLDPVPGSLRVVGWLRDHGGSAAPVLGKYPETPSRPGPYDRSATGEVRLDLGMTPVHVFDLGVDSTEFGLTPLPQNAADWTDLLFRKMRSVKAEVGVGRYDEVRRWYTADVFRAPGEEAPEWRTVHLGIDLFAEEGSPVFAPFDGTVHSFAHNQGDLDYGPALILEHTAEKTADGLPVDESSRTESDPGLIQGDLRFWTLYGHLGKDVLTRFSPGQRVAKGEMVAHLGGFPNNGNWPPHLHFQIITHPMGAQGDFPGVCRPSQRTVWKALSPDPNLVLGLPFRDGDASDPSDQPVPGKPGKPTGVPLTPRTGRPDDAILEARKRLLGPTLSIAYRKPIKIVRGVGQVLYDQDGQGYLDCGEANELALRLARAHTGRRAALVVEGAYHGNTSALVDLSPYKFAGPGGEGPPPWVHVVPMPDPYRGMYRTAGEEGPVPDRADPQGPLYLPTAQLGYRYAGEVNRGLSEMEEAGMDAAAFFCEPLLGCGGQIVPPPGYLEEAFQYVRDSGGVCVADEVQVGFGRVGTHFWAFESQGVVPDIVTLGKPMANGHPIGAVVTTPEIAASFRTGMEYFNTFGGNPVSCAIGLTVLDVIATENLQENARVVGGRLLGQLRGLRSRHALIGDVRGLGLFLGIELVVDRETREPAAAEAARVKEQRSQDQAPHGLHGRRCGPPGVHPGQGPGRGRPAPRRLRIREMDGKGGPGGRTASGADRRTHLSLLRGNVGSLAGTSFLNDTASEMAYPLLPLFLVGVLGAGPAFLGVVEGIAESTAALAKLGGGFLSDRTGRRKLLVVWGYGLAAAVRPLLALVAAPFQVLVIRFADRAGKGIRSAPRDALIVDSVPKDRRGTAFGLHRSADHAGSVLGPLLAACALLLVPGNLRLVFALTAIPGLLAVFVLIRGVREVAPETERAPGSPEGEPMPRRPSFRSMGRGFPTLLGVFFLFALGNASDAFLLLRAQQLGVSVATLPLLWGFFHVSKMVWNVPGGMLSDRFRPEAMILAGWIFYAGVYGGFGLADEAWEAWALFGVYGLFYGLTESPEKALVADLAPAHLRARAFGAFHFAVGLGALPASLLFGILWQWKGAPAAFGLGAGLALMSAALLPLALRGLKVTVSPHS